MEKNAKISVGALGTYFIDIQPDIETNEEPMLPIITKDPEKVELPKRKTVDEEDNASTEIPLMPNFK